MTKMQFRDFRRDILKTLASFLSILTIIALGAGAYSGLRSTGPDMELTADTYFDDSHLMDFRMQSNFGIVQEDIEALQALDWVDEVEGGYSLDATLSLGENYIVKLHSLSQMGFNTPTVIGGALPQQVNECAIEQRTMSSFGLALGDTITLDTSTGALEDPLADASYIITAVVDSPLYISLERGTSSIGNGSVDAFILLPESAFQIEYFTDLYIRSDQLAPLNTFSREYTDAVDRVRPELEAVAEKRGEVRYDEIYTEAQQELDDAAEQLETGRQELADAEQQLADSEEELETGVADAEKKLADAQKTITDSQKAISDGEAEVQSAWDQVNQAKPAVEEAEALYAELRQTESQLADTKAGLDEMKTSMDELEAQINQLKNAGEGNEEAIAQLEAQYTPLKTQYDQGMAEWEQATAAAAASRQQLEAQITEEQLAANRQSLNSAEAGVRDAEARLAQAREDLAEGQQDYRQGQDELDEKRTQGETDLENARKDLDAAKQEFEENERAYQEAKQELEDLGPQINWYIQDRTSNSGFNNFSSDADRIGSLASVFPMIFFLVAALMALTTMTRMVETKRTQMGVMRTIGFNKISITIPFVLYGFLASIIGSVIGFLNGSQLIPTIIYEAYAVMYKLPQLMSPYWSNYLVQSVGMSVGFVTIATIGGCYYAFTETPSQLMRPRVPKPGKRIFLEKISILWRLFSFRLKVTCRNLFRYKIRFIFTVVGIAGCMALVITGFGLKDSIWAISGVQYGELNRSDLVFYLVEDAERADRDEIVERLETDSRVSNRSRLLMKSTDLKENAKLDGICYYVVPESAQALEPLMIFRNRATHEKIPLTDDGVVITEKMAERLGIQVGDTIEFELNERMVGLSVTGITENYIGHYIYMTPETYQQNVIGKPTPKFNMVYVGCAGSGDISAVAEEFLSLAGVSSIVHVQTTLQSYENSLQSIDVAVWVIIIAAAALALVVIYNLNNINILERIREIATIKVLGYYNGEVTSYMLRENVFLTLLGIGLGMVLGVFLHGYMVKTIETNMVMFGRTLQPVSIAYSVVLTAIFAIAVNALTYFRLKRVDMVEALKSPN